MTILEKIVARKREKIAERKEIYPIKLLEQSIYFDTEAVSLVEYLTRPDKVGIIAEFKRRSPSRGDINTGASVEEVSIGYMQAGASALSVLTDEEFFGGSNHDLRIARKYNFCPILRKDFIIDEYQIIEARSIGADAILLIAACLTTEEIGKFTRAAQGLGLEVLLEVHDQAELEASYIEGVSIVGVNNRDLKTFSVDVQRSVELADLIPEGVVKISESGISSVEDILMLKQVGFDGFLIGESFMGQSQPGKSCARFIESVRRAQVEAGPEGQ